MIIKHHLSSGCYLKYLMHGCIIKTLRLSEVVDDDG